MSREYPVDFDLKLYRSANGDLSKMSDVELVRHYSESGMKEGRICNAISNSDLYHNLIDKTKDILDIGPLHRPIMDPSSPNYYSIDVHTYEELVEKYKADKTFDVTKMSSRERPASFRPWRIPSPTPSSFP